MNRYYSRLRPVSIGTYPAGMVLDTHNYDSKTFVEAAGCEVYGYIDYDRELSKEEIEHYDLVPGWLKPYWVVVTSVDDHGHVISNITGTEMHCRKPDTFCKESRRIDIYIDYFESREEAEQYVEDARKA